MGLNGALEREVAVHDVGHQSAGNGGLVSTGVPGALVLAQKVQGYSHQVRLSPLAGQLQNARYHLKSAPNVHHPDTLHLGPNLFPLVVLHPSGPEADHVHIGNLSVVDDQQGGVAGQEAVEAEDGPIGQGVTCKTGGH